MAKVVLVWNEHPTEVVAGFHARKVAKILKERYGHEVIMEKIPVGETNYGILQNEKPSTAALYISALDSSMEIANKTSEEHAVGTFNFHATPFKDVAEAKTKAPKEFTVGEKLLSGSITDIFHGPHEIEFTREPGENHYVVEMPAFETRIPYRIRKRRQQKLKAATRAADRDLTWNELGMAEYGLRSGYHLSYMPLRHPSQQKYLHPAISEKIAAAIHERITQRKPH